MTKVFVEQLGEEARHSEIQGQVTCEVVHSDHQARPDGLALDPGEGASGYEQGQDTRRPVQSYES